MGKLSLEDLRKIRETAKVALDLRNPENKDTQVVVSMGTCGIAAGAKDVFSALVDIVAEKALGNVMIRQVGCIGKCDCEPVVEVLVPGMDPVVYGKVDINTAKEIIEKHVIAHEVLSDKVCK